MSLRGTALLALKPAPQLVASPKSRTFAVPITNLTHTGQAIRVLTGGPLEILRELAVSEVVQKKQDRELFTCGVLKPHLAPTDSILKEESLDSIQLQVLDLDDITASQVGDVVGRLRASGYYFAMYATHSWTPENPKWRVVMPLSRNAPVETHHRRWAGLGKLAGVNGDPCAKKPAQRYFAASQPPGAKENWPDPIRGGTRCADPDELEALAPSEVLAPVVKANVNDVNAEALIQRIGDNRVRDFGLIAAECPLMGAFKAGVALPEPEWRVVIGTLKYCRDGEAIFHEYSALDPRYDRREAQRKWDGWKDDVGPAKCGNSPRCASCKHSGVTTAPIQLGDLESGPTSKQQPADAVKLLAAVVQASGIQAVMDTNSVLHLVYTSSGNGREVRTVEPASSMAATDALTAAAAKGGKAPSKSALETLTAQMRHAARIEGQTVQVYLRVAEVGQVIYKDLAPGRIARIDADGFKVVGDVADGVPLFSRGSSAGEIPNPESFTSPCAALTFWMKTLLGSFSVTPAQALIILAVVLDWHRTSTPHPVLEIVGPAGCGKSTLGEFILQLVDPAGDGGRVTVGTAGPDIAAAAQQLYVLPLDNSERFDKATSNLLCIVSTGGTLQVRMYYAQSETTSLKLHRPVLVTAVAPACTAPDLQSRVIRIELPVRRTGFSAEGEMRSKWRDELPRLQGVIFTLMAGVLGELPSVRASGDWGHRLVDFDQLGEAMIRSAGLAPGKFTKALGLMRERMARRAASGDLFLMALVSVLKKLSEKPTHADHVTLPGVLNLTPALAVVAYDDTRVRITARPEALHQRLPITAGAFDRNNAMPGSARGLTDALRRVQPMLASLAVDVEELTARGRTVLRFDFDREAVNEV